MANVAFNVGFQRPEFFVSFPLSSVLATWL